MTLPDQHSDGNLDGPRPEVVLPEQPKGLHGEVELGDLGQPVGYLKGGRLTLKLDGSIQQDDGHPREQPFAGPQSLGVTVRGWTFGEVSRRAG